MDKAARLLSDYVVKKGVIQKEEWELYCYGFEIALEAAVSFIASILIASVLHMVLEGILFFAFFYSHAHFCRGASFRPIL